jgi:5-methylcytosine-specific restriction enzyme A
MEKEKPIIYNYGILTSISWNDNKWADDPSEADLKASKYDYVKDNAHMHESLNFGHETYPVEEDGFYIGYTPMFNRPPALENSKNVNIVFFVSSDYKNQNRKSIIGFYGFPEFGEWFKRQTEHPKYKTYDSGNIKAFPENVIYFEKPIIINNENVREKNLLPNGKLISQQGFNYLNSDNVYNLIVLALELNPTNTKLRTFVKQFPLLVEITNEGNEIEDFYIAVGDATANTLAGIKELERKMSKQPPEIKHRISFYIERGAIATKIKKLAGYKCLICEAFKSTPYGFKKSNGDYYIETHHVEPVSSLKSGVLSISNLLTVCANHHRQLHYGNVEIIEQSDKHLKLSIDGETVNVEKININ